MIIDTLCRIFFIDASVGILKVPTK